MSHVHRFYIPPEAGGPEVVLDGAEAHHALHVVRVKPGAPVSLFDGAGREVSGEVAGATRATVTVAVTGERRVPPPESGLTLIQAALHRERAVEELIRRCTELGVSRFRFFRARRSERAPQHADKWLRWAVDSCKQCGRLWLPRFETAAGLSEALEGVSGALLTATPHRPPTPLRDLVLAGGATLVVGPEGDLADEELALAEDRGARFISLGEATFRSEAAAVVAAALVLYEMGTLGPR